MDATNAEDDGVAADTHDAPVEVATVGSRAEGDLIVGLLRSNGLSATVLTDDAGGLQPQWQSEGVRVLVAASDAEAARALLAEPAPDALGDGDGETAEPGPGDAVQQRERTDRT